MRRLWLLAPMLLCAADAPGKVRLEAPRGGWTSQRVVAIRGVSSDRRARSVELGLNGERFDANVRNGRFEARLPVRPGMNALEVVSADGAARDATTFYSAAPAVDVKVLLRWSSAGPDLDLRVTEPDGEECYHGNRSTASGGTLEVDDTDGFGPEVYLLPHAPPGEYRIAVASYASRGEPQIDARVTAVVHEGRPSERRYEFAVTLTREGETLEVGSFRIERPLR
ncbi:MAG: YfaP family protein [Myxococcales bacterium]